MKVAADTSVLVAAFASWHEQHGLALRAIERIDAVIAHCVLETYSVLTRLPSPHRMSSDVVATYLEQTFAGYPAYALPAAKQRDLIATYVEQRIIGGSIYDALIGVTCTHANVKLLTLDRRARQTYAALEVEHEIVAA